MYLFALCQEVLYLQSSHAQFSYVKYGCRLTLNTRRVRILVLCFAWKILTFQTVQSFPKSFWDFCQFWFITTHVRFNYTITPSIHHRCCSRQHSSPNLQGTQWPELIPAVNNRIRCPHATKFRRLVTPPKWRGMVSHRCTKQRCWGCPFPGLLHK